MKLMNRVKCKHGYGEDCYQCDREMRREWSIGDAIQALDGISTDIYLFNCPNSISFLLDCLIDEFKEWEEEINNEY